MAKRPVVNTVPSGALSTNVINDNFNNIKEHFDTVLSRDGSIPNNMTADLDMDGNQILNLPPPVDPTEPLRKADVDVDGLNQAAQDAELYTIQALQSSQSAAASSAQAGGYASDASVSATTATNAVSGFTTVVDDATTDFNTLVSTSTSDINTLTTNSLNDINTAAQQVDIKQTQINASTGILEGGVLSGVIGGTTFDITAGNGIILDNYTDPSNPVITRVTWPAMTGITATQIGTGNESNYVFIDKDGNVVQKPTRTRSDLRDKIYVGLVGVDLTQIQAIVSTKASPITQVAHTIDDLADAIGAINIAGNVYGPNGANLKIDKTAGEVFQVGINFDVNKKNPNYRTNATQTDTGSFYFYRDGVGGFNVLPYNDVDPTQYDDGSGTLQPVGANQWTIVPIYMGTITDSAFLLYGQGVYGSKVVAQGLLATQKIETPPVLMDTILRGYLIVRGGATNLTLTGDAEFVEANLAGTGGGGGSGSTTTLQDAYDNSAEPEILTDATRGAVNLRSHSVSPADVFVIEENAGSAVTTLHNTGGLTTSGSVVVNNADLNVTGTGTISGDGSGITDVRSTDSDNLITLGTDNKTAVKATNLISSDADNGLSVGTDGKLLGPANNTAYINDTGQYVFNKVFTFTIPGFVNESGSRLLVRFQNGYKEPFGNPPTTFSFNINGAGAEAVTIAGGAIGNTEYYAIDNGAVVEFIKDNLGNWRMKIDVVSFFANSTFWVKQYSNGWKEQGGFTTSLTINFPLNFNDTEYTVQVAPINNTAYSDTGLVIRDTTRTESSVSVARTVELGGYFWEAKGF